MPLPILVGTFLVLAWLTYEDIRVNRVPNSAVGLLLLFGLSYQVLGVINYLFHWWQSILLFLVAGIIAVALYWRRYWGAGDAKLFWVVSLLLPLEQRLDFIQEPAGFLVAAYAVLFSYMVVWVTVIIVRDRRAAFVAVMRKALNQPWKLLFTLAYQYVGIIGFSRMVSFVLRVNLGFLQGIILTPILYYLLQYWAKKYWLLAFAPFALAGGYFFARQPLNVGLLYLWQFVILLLLTMGREVAAIVKLTRIEITSVRPGQLVEDLVKFEPGPEYVTVTIKEPGGESLSAGAGGGDAFYLEPGPLSPDNYQHIQQLFQGRYLVGSSLVRVRRTLPFGPAICVAFVLMWTLR